MGAKETLQEWWNKLRGGGNRDKYLPVPIEGENAYQQGQSPTPQTYVRNFGEDEGYKEILTPDESDVHLALLVAFMEMNFQYHYDIEVRRRYSCLFIRVFGVADKDMYDVLWLVERKLQDHNLRVTQKDAFRDEDETMQLGFWVPVVSRRPQKRIFGRR